MRSFPVLAATVSFAVVALGWASPARAQGGGGSSVCENLLSPQEITEATGLTVGKGQKGPQIAGSQGSCVWRASDGTKILVVLSNKRAMETTMGAMAQTGGSSYDGLGTAAVGTKGIAETGGGYNLSFVDSKGGVAVTIPGNAGTSGRTLALGKLIEQRRSGDAPDKDKQDATSGDHGQTADDHGKTADDHGQKAGHGQTADDHGQTAPNQP